MTPSKCSKVVVVVAAFVVRTLLATYSILGIFQLFSMARGDDRAEDGVMVGLSNSTLGFYVGDRCITGCSEVLSNAFCNQTTERCECPPNYPIIVDRIMCVEPVGLGRRCIYSESCSLFDKHATCQQLEEDYSECRCKPFHHASSTDAEGNDYLCVQDHFAPIMKITKDVPSLVGLGIACVFLLTVVCVILRTFCRTPTHCGLRVRSCTARKLKAYQRPGPQNRNATMMGQQPPSLPPGLVFGNGPPNFIPVIPARTRQDRSPSFSAANSHCRPFDQHELMVRRPTSASGRYVGCRPPSPSRDGAVTPPSVTVLDDTPDDPLGRSTIPVGCRLSGPPCPPPPPPPSATSMNKMASSSAGTPKQQSSIDRIDPYTQCQQQPAAKQNNAGNTTVSQYPLMSSASSGRYDPPVQRPATFILGGAPLTSYPTPPAANNRSGATSNGGFAVGNTGGGTLGRRCPRQQQQQLPASTSAAATGRSMANVGTCYSRADTLGDGKKIGNNTGMLPASQSSGTLGRSSSSQPTSGGAAGQPAKISNARTSTAV